MMRFREKQKGTLSKLQVKTTGRVFSSSSFVSFVSFVSFRFRSFSFVFVRFFPRPHRFALGLSEEAVHDHSQRLVRNDAARLQPVPTAHG